MPLDETAAAAKGMLASVAVSSQSPGKLPPLVSEPVLDRWLYWLLALLAVAGYFVAMHTYWSPAHPGTDQNGYLVGGKYFAGTGSTGFTPSDPYAFVGRMWVQAENGRFFPKYPLGLSVIYAAAMKIGGAKHGLALTFMISPAAMTFALAATFLLLRIAVGSFAALLGTLLVATSPVAIGLTNNPNSHATAACLIAWGIYLLVCWWQCNGLARAIGAGLLLGSAVTIRYTEGLVVLPLIIVALLNLRWRSARSWIETASLGAAWALPVVILLAYNWFSFHHLTGYDPCNESTGFSWEYFKDNWETMTRQLYNTGLFFVLPFSVLGLMWMWRWNWRVALLLCAWILPCLLLYTAYYWAPDTAWIGYLRFFLTIIPALALAAVWSLNKLIELAAREGSWLLPRLAVAALVAIGCGVNLNTALGEVEIEAKNNACLALASDRILKACPAGSVVFAQERTLNWVQLVGSYQLYDMMQFNRAAIQRYANIDPDAPNGLQPQRAKEMYDRLKDFNEEGIIREQNKLMSDAMARGQRVFFVVPKPATPQVQRLLTKRLFLSKTVVSWDEPADVRAGRRLRFGFRGQPAAVDQTRITTWQIMEVTAAPPPPPPPPPRAVLRVAPATKPTVNIRQRVQPQRPANPSRSASATGPTTVPTP